MTETAMDRRLCSRARHRSRGRRGVNDAYPMSFSFPEWYLDHPEADGLMFDITEDLARMEDRYRVIRGLIMSLCVANTRYDRLMHPH